MAQVAFKEKVTKRARKGSSAGSTLGGLIGLGAALAAPATGGASLAAASGAMAIGSKIGGMFGDTAPEAAEIEQKGGVQAGGSMQRRRDALDQVEQLKKAQAAVMQLPPAQQESFAAPINEALARAQKSIQQGSAV